MKNSFTISLFPINRNLRNNRTRIHKNLFIAMVIQVLIRLILYIDQVGIKNYYFFVLSNNLSQN